MPDKSHVMLVNGYGCHEDTPLGAVYLPKIVEFLNKKEPCMIIFSGGDTQKKSAPGVFESWLMADIVLPQLGYRPNDVYRDTNSYTTLGNVKNGALQIAHRLYGQKVQITIGCEATRAANVVMLARHFMSNLVDSIDDITVETASWERADPFLQAKNLIYSKLAIKYPWLGLAEREHRRRIRRSYEI